MRGTIFDIDHFAVHDGPGIRTTVFLKGCPLRCIWCHSPESQKNAPEILFISSRCTSCCACMHACPEGLQQMDTDGERHYKRHGCKGCGACINVCHSEALVFCGSEVTSQEVVEEALQDAVFYRKSGGGVTLTGGEVLSQPEFVLEILKGLKKQDIHTIVETSGVGSWEHLKEWIPYVDLFYYDLKVIDPVKHIKFTGSDNKIIIDNLKRLRELTSNIVLRVPLIPGYTDGEDDIMAIYLWAVKNNICHIHLLPYNSSAPAKYEWVGRDFIPRILNRQSFSVLKRLKDIAPQRLEVEII